MPEPAPKPATRPESGDDFGTEPFQPTTSDERSDDFYASFADEPRFDADREDDRLGEPMAATIPFDDLRREPVSVGGGGSGKMRTLVWTLVVLALVGVLVAQVTWYQFDRLSAIPELRPFYEQGCELAGCELEPLVNVDAIQSRKLVVRTDPENRTQLVVDAVIINLADFEQPFPGVDERVLAPTGGLWWKDPNLAAADPPRPIADVCREAGVQVVVATDDHISGVIE